MRPLKKNLLVLLSMFIYLLIIVFIVWVLTSNWLYITASYEHDFYMYKTILIFMAALPLELNTMYLIDLIKNKHE